MKYSIKYWLRRGYKVVIATTATTIAISCLAADMPIMKTDIYDQFESDSWLSYWKKELPFSHSATVIQSPLNDSQVIRFEWQIVDWDGTRQKKGAELTSPWLDNTHEHWVSFKFLIDPKLMPTDSKPVIIMQYQAIPDKDLGESWRNPITDLSYQNGELTYRYRSSKEPITPGTSQNWNYTSKGAISLGKPNLNTWNYITIHQIFDHLNQNGKIEIWLNDSLFSRKSISLGYNDKHGPYFKFGLYCPYSSDEKQRIIYFDDVRLSSSPISHAIELKYQSE